MARFAAAVVLASAAALVSAQSASVPSCVLPCFSSSLTSSGSSCVLTDIACLCKDTNFQVAAVKCFIGSCGSDVAAAEAFGTQSCSAVGVTVDTGAISSALAAGTGSASAGASSTAAPAASSASAAASSAASSVASAASSVQASATSAAAAITSAAAAATSKASSADKVAVTGVLGFVAGLVALLA